MDDDLVDVVMNKHIGGGDDVSSPETKKKQEAETKKKEKQRTRRGMKRIKTCTLISKPRRPWRYLRSSMPTIQD